MLITSTWSATARLIAATITSDVAEPPHPKTRYDRIIASGAIPGPIVNCVAE